MLRPIDLLYTLLFCAAIGIVPASAVLGLGHAPPGQIEALEYRPRTELAAFGWGAADLRRLAGAIEPFARDRMPHRATILAVHTAVRRMAGASLAEDMVVVGSDGWLFFGNAHARSIDQHRGLRQLDEKGLADAVRYFRSIRDELAVRGIPFVVAIAPDKHSVYPEHLPRHLSKAGRTPTDQLLDADTSQELFLDLRPAMDAAKRRSDLLLYCKLDSHWNQRGAYVAYREIMRRLAIGTALEIPDSRFVRVMSFTGDIVPMVGVGWHAESETAGLADHPPSRQLVLRRLSDGVVQAPPPSPMTRITDHKAFVVTNPRREGTLLVLGDSFADGLSMYFNYTFGTTVYQHYRHSDGRSVASLADEFHPQAAVLVIAGRLLLDRTSAFIPPGSRAESTPTVIANESLIDPAGLVRGIGRIRTEQGDACFDATDNDPYFHLPPVPPMPAGATVTIDITLPGGRLVQLYYQTATRPQFCEEQSVKAELPAGRHRLELRIGEALNGNFRLDPGNGPGEYRIHRISVQP